MKDLLTALAPELFLSIVACALFLMGTATGATTRRLAGHVALYAVLGVFLLQCYRVAFPMGYMSAMASHAADPVTGDLPVVDAGGAVHVHALAQFVKLIAAGVGGLLVLLNMPTDPDATGTSASQTGTDTAEFFGLLLLSLTGLMLVASANDLTLLFLGIELASIPTYIMVSISRPLPVAQEAGLKYFFLGAMAAAVMLFGFSYLYGVTGTTSLDAITAQMSATDAPFTPWLVLAVLLLIGGFAFKMAAVPLHAYAGDVYQGAATPVTAVLSFVPKVSGFVALIKVLHAVGGGQYRFPESIVLVLAWTAGLTMTIGNVLALRQFNVKRTLAYSSVAHSGYMLVAVTAMAAAGGHSGADSIGSDAVKGVLFYLATYGLMNVAAFGVLQLLPSRNPQVATSAETMDDLAGQGRRYPGLGLAMAVACLGLAGVPATSGFLGKVYLTGPAARADLIVLSVVLWVNAAISAAYYLRLIATMFLRPEPAAQFGGPAPTPVRAVQPTTVVLAVFVGALATVLIGVFPPVTRLLTGPAESASRLDPPPTTPMHMEPPAMTAAVDPR